MTPTTTPMPIPCGLMNPSFEDISMPQVMGWDTLTSLDGTPNLISSGCQSGTSCLNQGVPSETDPPGCTMSVGVAELNQNWFMYDCMLSISFWYRSISSTPNASEDSERVSAYIREANGGAFVAILLDFTPPEGSLAFSQYTCDVCDGSCGGVNLTPYIGQELSISFRYRSGTTACGGAIWDNVCIQ